MTAEMIGQAPVAPGQFLSPEEDELNKNAFIHRSLSNAVRTGRSYEDGLAGLVAQALEKGPVTGESRWRRRWTAGTGTVFEFSSLAEFIESPDGLATQPSHLIQLLEISPNPEAAALRDQVAQELKLPPGRPRAETGNNIPSKRTAAAEVRQSERGTSSAGVRRRIRNWIAQNPQADNLPLAQQWLEKLEANPKSRLHQQALREIGIATLKPKRVLDVSGVPAPLIQRLYDLAQDEQISVSEVLEDALAVYFRMDDEATSHWGEEVGDVAETQTPGSASGHTPAASKPSKPASSNGNGHNKTAGIIELPKPGFYSATQLGTLLGKKPTSVSSYVAKRSDGEEVWTRDFASTPLKAVVRKNRPRNERIEVMQRA